MPATRDEIKAWFAARQPDSWSKEPPEVTVDDEEIVVVVNLPEVEVAEGGSPDAMAAAREARTERFREESRDQRMRIAAEAERRFRRKVSWGAACGDQSRLYTTLSMPVMTRLRMRERSVLDTLVDSGVARSRSEALAWCVRLVGKHQSDWIEELREALVRVEAARAKGPSPH
jgi:hypothetical protein